MLEQVEFLQIEVELEVDLADLRAQQPLALDLVLRRASEVQLHLLREVEVEEFDELLLAGVLEALPVLEITEKFPVGILDDLENQHLPSHLRDERSLDYQL